MRVSLTSVTPKAVGRTFATDATGGCTSQQCAHVYRRTLSQNQGQRYHSDIQHIYILHDRPLASSDSRTTGSVERFSDTLCTCSPDDLRARSGMLDYDRKNRSVTRVRRRRMFDRSKNASFGSIERRSQLPSPRERETAKGGSGTHRILGADTWPQVYHRRRSSSSFRD